MKKFLVLQLLLCNTLYTMDNNLFLSVKKKLYGLFAKKDSYETIITKQYAMPPWSYNLFLKKNVIAMHFLHQYLLSNENIVKFIRKIAQKNNISNKESLERLFKYYLSLEPLQLHRCFRCKDNSDHFLLLELILAAELSGYDQYIIENRKRFEQKYVIYGNKKCAILDGIPVFRSVLSTEAIEILPNNRYSLSWRVCPEIVFNYIYINILPISLHELCQQYFTKRCKILLHYKKIFPELVFSILSFLTTIDPFSCKIIVPEIQPLLINKETGKDLITTKKELFC